MKTFLVVATGTNPVNQKLIQDKFEHYYIIAPDLVWMVASGIAVTPRMICEELGIYLLGGKNYTGIVIDLSVRNGFASEELVSTLHGWEEK